MTDHRKHALGRATTVNVPIPAAHRPQWRAKVSPNRIEQRFTKSQAAGGIADKRSKNIPFSQRRACRRAEPPLAAPKKHPAMNFAHSIETGEFIVENSRQKHEAIRFEVIIA